MTYCPITIEIARVHFSATRVSITQFNRVIERHCLLSHYLVQTVNKQVRMLNNIRISPKCKNMDDKNLSRGNLVFIYLLNNALLIMCIWWVFFVNQLANHYLTILQSLRTKSFLSANTALLLLCKIPLLLNACVLSGITIIRT